MTSYQPISLAELKEKCSLAKQYLDNKQIPIDIFKDFTDYIQFVAEDPVSNIYSQPETKKFFFEEFLDGMCRRVTTYKYIDEEVEESLPQVHDTSIIEKLSEEERAWRQDLQVGSRIDGVKIDKEYNLKMWSKGTVIERNGDFLKVLFDQDSKLQSRLFAWYSPEIDKEGAKSEDDQWRLDLKKGDFIDAYDSTKIWYGATIQDTEVRIEDDRQIYYLYVGFRIYHPDGNKEDDNKQKFFGWSERFDEWIPATNPRIQKYQSYVKILGDQQTKSASLTYEETIDDQMDVLLYSSNKTTKPVYAVIRRRCKSGLLVQILNRLGENGVYQRILDRILLPNNDNLGLETVFYYLDCLAKSICMFTKPFVNDYLPKLEQAVRQKLLTASEFSLRNIKKDRIDGIVQNLVGGLMNRIRSYKQREWDKHILQLDIACVFLQQNFLERRIDGAKMIADVCKATNLQTYSAVTETVHNNQAKQIDLHYVSIILGTLKDKKVLYQIFSKERGHLELVQRSEELLKLLIGQDALNQEELEFVWSCTNQYETTKLELYKIFNEISSRLRGQEITFIINQIDQIPLNKIVIEEIELFTGQSFGQSSSPSINRSNYELEQSEQTHLCRENRAQTLRCKDSKQYLQNSEGFLPIKMLQRIIKDFQGNFDSANYQNQEENGEENYENLDKFSNKQTFIEFIVKEYRILEVFFDNFKHYMLKARSNLRKKLEQDPNLDVKTMFDKVLAEKFVHSEQINERLEFIKYLSQNSNAQVTKDHLDTLWTELVAHSMFKQDSNLFYRWLKDVCDMQTVGSSCVSLDDLIGFFRETVNREDQQVLSQISIDGFNCIQSFFILINESNKKLIRLNQSTVGTQQKPVQKFTAYSSTTGQEYKSYSFNQNKQGQGNSASSDDDIDFNIMVKPSDLENIQGIWLIAVNSTDVKVTEKVIQFLIKLYTSVTYALESQVVEFENQFIQICIHRINQLRSDILNRKEKPKEEFEKVVKPLNQFTTLTSVVMQKILPPEERQILRYMLLMKELIKNSEKDGTRGVKSHLALFKGEYLHTLQISNNLKSGQKYQNKFELGVYSNTTLWELRKIIGEHVSRVYTGGENDPGKVFFQDTPCHPASIRLYCYAGCTDLKESDNARTLAELKFKPNEQLTAFRRNLFSSSKVPLLNIDQTDMSERAYEIFTQWFNEFSIEDPDNPGRRVMTPATCAAFTRKCTDDNCTEEDSRVTGLFSIYDQDNDGKIQLNEFLSFYRNCCFEKEEIVRQNLMSFYIRYDLKRQPIDGEDEYMMQVRPALQDMPRFKLSSEPFYFESIFSLLDLQGEVSNNAWSLIKQLSTNPQLYRKVLALDKDEGFQWSQIFDSGNIYKMLYALQIVEALLEEETSHHASHDEDLQTQSEEQILKRDWIERFLTLGGFQQILSLFHASLDLLGQKHVDSLSKFEKSFLEYMLKLIRIFIISAYSANDQSVYELLNLVKKSSTFSNQEQAPETNEKATETQDNQNQKDIYKTPSKQVKGKFVNQKDANKKIIDNFYQPEITQDFLFGETLEEKPDPEKQEQNQEQKDTQALTSSAQQVNIDNESERFSQMAQIMKETGLGEIILKKIDFKDLQLQVLEVVCLILGKKEINAEDMLIMENALSLWVASLIKNDNLIEDFYKYERSEEKSGMLGIKKAEDLILAGIYCYKSFKVRDEFTNTLNCICSKVRKNDGVKPLFYVLDIMKKNFPREDQYYTTRECKQFFDLFISLVDEFILLKTTDQLDSTQIDVYDLLREAIEKLKRHETKEKKGSILEDKTLIGYFSLIEKLINYLQGQDKDRLQQVLEDTNIIHELFYENLFYNPMYSRSKVENKSKTKESRAACYQLFQKVIESLPPRELADFLEDNLWPLIKDLPRPAKWRYVPAENTKSSQFVGIVNLGCICYMISMLQQFFMVPQFRYQLLRAEDTSPEDIKEYKGMKIDDNLLRQLQKMYGFLELSEKQAYDPVEFCFAFKDFEGNPTNTAIQNDAQEFLNIFFDRIEELLKPTSQQYLLQSVFGGKNCSQLICKSCGKVRNILESFYNLSVPVKDRKGLEDSLQKMIEMTEINDYKCEACNQRVDVNKRTLIAETPNVLIVHLQRIIFNFDTFQNDKINSRFDFPNVLDLKEYSFKEVMKDEGRLDDYKDDETVKHLLDMKDDEFIYKLVGVIIHSGTADYGHYYSLINTKRGQEEVDESKPEWAQTDKDQWREFNDNVVKYFTFNDLKEEAFGGSANANSLDDNEMNAFLLHSGAASSYGKNAYMLVYERNNKKPLKEMVKQELQVETNDQTSLECANTADSRVVQTTQKLIPYREVTPYVPDQIKMKVLQDNNLFLIDRHIYHESFVNLLKGIFKHISGKILLTQHQYKYDYSQHFTRLKSVSLEIAHKTLFELLTYYYHNTQMSDITSSLQSIITFCDSSYTLSRGSPSLLLEFINKCFVEDNCQHFFKIMFECVDKTSRYYIGKITAYVINKAYQLYDESENKQTESLVELRQTVDNLVVRFIQILKTSECQKNWHRLEQFFKIIQEVGCGGKWQIELLHSKFDIIVEMIDFMLGNRSPLAQQRGEKRFQMGGSGHGNSPPFQPLVAFVCHITRFCLTPVMRDEQHLWNNTDYLPPSTLLGYNLEENQRGEEKYPLTERAYQFIVATPFVESVLAEGIECEELGKVLAHFCYKNLKMTKYVCKLLLHGISRNDIDRVKNYLDVVTQIALIKDELQRKRLEWIFGFGSLIGQTASQNNAEDQIQTKLGAKILQSSNDEVYQYKSSLIYDSIDDALLHLLWRYKGRMDTYTVHCLFSLLNLIAADESVAEYFSELPGPTYSLSRYTDWIRPYLNDQLIDARKGYSGSFSAQKEEMVVKALSLLEKYEQFLTTKTGVTIQQRQVEIIQEKVQIQDSELQEEENVRNLIEQSPDNQTRTVQYQQEQSNEVIQCNPQPYIIVDCLSEKPIIINNMDNVQLTISELSCYYTASLPTGTGNQALPKNFFRKNHYYNNTQRFNHNQKEQEMQAQCINNYFQSSTFTKKQQKEQSQEDYFNQYEPNDQSKFEGRVIQDDNRQWDMVNNMNVSDIDDEEGGYQQDSEGGPKLVNVNSGIEEDTQKEVSYKIQVVEENGHTENLGEAHASINYDGQQEYNREAEALNVQINEPERRYPYSDEEQETAITEQQQQEMIWPNEVKYCQDLVYKITVQNQRNTPVKVSLQFKEVNENEPCNLAYPKGGIKALVFSKQTKTIIFLHKIIPDESEGEIYRLNIDSHVKDKYNDKNSNVQVYPAPPTNQAVTNQEVTDLIQTALGVIKENQQEQDIGSVSDSDIKAGDEATFEIPQDTGLKSCHICTYLNDPKNVICEMCYQTLA